MMNQVVEILLVEDDPSDEELTLHALRRCRIANDIRIARDGAEALELIFGETKLLPKVVLLDLKLPKVDGLEVLRRIKSDPGTREIPVVALTSSGEHRDLVQSYELGVNSYIVKPVDFGQFTEALRQVGLYWVGLNQRSTGSAEDP